jgi:transposase
MATSTVIGIAQRPTPHATVFVAFALRLHTWKLGFTTGNAQRPRERSVLARDIAAVQQEITSARPRFGWPEDVQVVSGYEAGRDGFWLHRWLKALAQRLAQWDAARRVLMQTAEDAGLKKVQQLLTLKGIGTNSAWGFVMECFGWRACRNGKAVGALSGLTPSPYASGNPV